jgi:hypothetical protein
VGLLKIYLVLASIELCRIRKIVGVSNAVGNRISCRDAGNEKMLFGDNRDTEMPNDKEGEIIPKREEMGDFGVCTE